MKLFLGILSFLFILNIAFAYPMGLIPGSQEVCIDNNTLSTYALINLQSGADKNLNFSVSISGPDWVSFGNNTTSGLVEIPSNSQVNVAIYIDAPANITKGIYNATFELCNIPLNNTSGITTIYCIPSKIIINVTDKCPRSEQTVEQTQNNYFLLFSASIIGIIALIIVINKLKWQK